MRTEPSARTLHPLNNARLAYALCVLVALLSFKGLHAQTLDEAYRSELARLQAEEVALSSALMQAKSQGERTQAELVRTIESLARTLTRLRAENAQASMQLPQSERMQSLQTQARSLEQRERQIETWLENHGVPLPLHVTKPADNQTHRHPPLNLMVKAALDHVQEHGQLWVQSDQEYFRTDGTATVDEVLHIAEVGAILVDGFRPLELASDGSLRVHSKFSPQSVEHGNARSVGAILFDPDDIRPSRRTGEGWRQWLDKGGGVMWAIAALAILALLVLLERLVSFALFFGRLGTAQTQGPTVAVPRSDKLLRPIALIQSGYDTQETMEDEAVEAILRVKPYVHRGISLLAIVASVAPLLGLLGTVTGMIGTFAVITEHGTGDPRLLSGGISEALLTTQFGLMVAIPALLGQTILYRMGDAILRRLEAFALVALEARLGHSQDTNVGQRELRHENVRTARSVT